MAKEQEYKISTNPGIHAGVEESLLCQGFSPSYKSAINMNEPILETPKSPKGDFFKVLIFSSSPLGARGKKDKGQHFGGFLDCTHKNNTRTIEKPKL